MRGARLGRLSVLALLAGCASSVPTGTIKATYTQAPPTPTISPIDTVAPSKPGQPYTAEVIDAAYATVPYDFPAQLRSQAIAAAIADSVWTFDGRPCRELLISGSCDDGGRRCDLHITGLPAFAPTREGSDDWLWSVDPSTGLLSNPNAGLNGFPQEMIPSLDELTHRLDVEGRVNGKELLGVHWLAPEGFFALRYGLGLEECDPTTTVVLDREERRILSMTTS